MCLVLWRCVVLRRGRCCGGPFFDVLRVCVCGGSGSGAVGLPNNHELGKDICTMHNRHPPMAQFPRTHNYTALGSCGFALASLVPFATDPCFACALCVSMCCPARMLRVEVCRLPAFPLPQPPQA